MKLKAFDKSSFIKCLFLILLIADIVFIFVNSSFNEEKSNNESGKVTEIVIDITHPGYDGLSASEKETVFESTSNIVRTAAHFIEYIPIGFFGTLLVLVYSGFTKKTVLYTSFVFIGGTLYAVTDEIHQLFTDGRSSEIGDVITDSLGCLFGIGIAILIYKIYTSIKNHGKISTINK